MTPQCPATARASKPAPATAAKVRKIELPRPKTNSESPVPITADHVRSAPDKLPLCPDVYMSHPTADYSPVDQAMRVPVEYGITQGCSGPAHDACAVQQRAGHHDFLQFIVRIRLRGGCGDRRICDCLVLIGLAYRQQGSNKQPLAVEGSHCERHRQGENQ